MDSVAQHQAAVALEIDVADMDVRVVPREIVVAGERAAIVGAVGSARHGCSRRRTSTDRGFHGRRTLCRSGNARRSQSSDHSHRFLA